MLCGLLQEELQNGKLLICKGIRKSGVGINAVFRRSWEIKNYTSVDAVSYTHLDVYKRQL